MAQPIKKITLDAEGLTNKDVEFILELISLGTLEKVNENFILEVSGNFLLTEMPSNWKINKVSSEKGVMKVIFKID